MAIAMRDLVFPEQPPERPDPVALARARQKLALPRRFYSDVTVEERPDTGHVILLDGRPARTPGRHLLALPNLAMAEVVAGDWRAQGGTIDPTTMHATRIANTALDAIARDPDPVRADLAAFAATDLVCYRATEPEGLIAWQNRHFDPVLDWTNQTLGVRFRLAGGIIHVAQPPEALAAVRTRLAAIGEPVRLAALHVMTTLTGSVLIALMTVAGALPAQDAFAASDCDEAWNRQQWGEDAEAMARRDRRWREFSAATALATA
jgi:chaperone required for assembly of F1-ATPase